MPFIIKLLVVQKLSFFLTLLIIFVSSYARAQTYSTEEIVISGLGFARFSVSLIAEDSFSEHPAASRWLRIFDRNLCLHLFGVDVVATSFSTLSSIDQKKIKKVI